MPRTLKKTTGWPTGGYPFRDPRTGKAFDGLSADLALQAQNVIRHRKANTKIYPPTETQWFNLVDVKQEIAAYMCDLKPELCAETALSLPVVKLANVVVQKSQIACPKCGSSEASPILCKTCRGSKVKGFTCLNCGERRNR